MEKGAGDRTAVVETAGLGGTPAGRTQARGWLRREAREGRDAPGRQGPAECSRGRGCFR